MHCKPLWIKASGKCTNVNVTYTCGVIDLHLGQQLAIDAEVAELTPVVVDDAVALTGH